jgi:sigma-B regulation protein RsbU (phosphoserine phosphatase)
MAMRPIVLHQPTRYERITRRIGLYVIAPLLLLLALPMAVHISHSPYLGMAVRNLTVASLQGGGPADRAHVRVGDRIVAVSGQPTRTMTDYYAALAGDYTLAPRRLILSRRVGDLAVEIQPTRPPRARMVWSYSLWLAGVAFLLIGWWVLARRQDAVARNFFALCMIFAFFLIDVPDYPSHAYLTGKEMLRDLLQLLWPVFFLRFFLLFPSAEVRTTEDRRWHRWLLLPAVVLYGLTLLVHLAAPDPAESRLVTFVQLAALIYFVVYFLAGLFIFARKALRRDRPIQHTKLRVILIGLVGGLLPFLVAMLFGNVEPGTGIPHWEYLGFSLLLVPATFGLAILRYGALDTAFVVRSSLIYGLLTLLVVVGYLVVVVALGHYLTQTFKVSAYPLAIVIIAASGLAILPLRRGIQRWIDKTFYPSRLASRKEVSRLAGDLAGEIDVDGAVATLLDRLDELYRPVALALLLADEPDTAAFAVTAARGDLEPDADNLSLPAESGLTRFLDWVRRPAFAEEFADVVATGDGDSASLTAVSALRSELLVPLVTGNRLSGFLSFGSKSTGALYSQEDLANLRSLAVQTASLLENRRLYRESLARRQLETELSVAKEIQARLLPEAPLKRAGLQLTGRHHACRKVGGDYFDYFPLGDDAVGFCIADVAGKGIPAALLMTTLRVSFRGTATAGVPPEAVVQRLNRTATGLLQTGQFICFFYGTYDLANRVLTYSNAGMDPPLLFRSRQGFVEKLKKGGPVLGVQADHRYRRGTLTLTPGDLVLFYTDGITEERNSEGEFFDLERLITLVARTRERPLGSILDSIFAAVEEFRGAERSDDKTVMLLATSKL